MSAEQEYNKKNKYLKEWLTPVDTKEFYSFIFPSEDLERPGHAEDNKPNMVFVLKHSQDGKTFFRNVIGFADYSSLSKVKNNDFAICSLCTYSGRNKTAKNAYKLYGFAIDLDGVGMFQLETLRMGFERKVFPYPTFIVNSGRGLHLYYIFFEPIPLYSRNVEILQKLKRGLSYRVWTKETSTYKEMQIQGIFQGFRMPGSLSKLGRTQKAKLKYPVTAFRAGKRVDITYLNHFVHESFKTPEGFDLYGSGIYEDEHLTLEKAKELYPEWYQRRIVEGKPRGRWVCHVGLYNWWLRTITTPGNAKEGNRYYCVAILFIIAIKCNISKEQAWKDALSLLTDYDDLTMHEENHFTEDDVYAASLFYKEEYVRYSINAIEAKTGIRIKRNIRHYRKQAEHLKIARFIQSMNNKNWRAGNGRKSKEALVKEYFQAHPEATIKGAARELGISKNTVKRWK